MLREPDAGATSRWIGRPYQLQAPDVAFVSGPHRTQALITRSQSCPDEPGVRRRSKHRPYLSTRDVNHPYRGISIFEEDSLSVLEKTGLAPSWVRRR